MKMIGMSVRSRELLLQVETAESRERHIEHEAAGNRRRADGTGTPAPRRMSRAASLRSLISSSSDSRTEMSSSTTNTIGADSGMVSISVDP